MKSLGFLLITVGFLGGSFAAVLDERIILSWPNFAFAIIAMAIGVALVRRKAREAATGEGQLVIHLKAVTENIGLIVEEITDLNGKKGEINTYDIRFEVDKRFPVALAEFADAREAIGHVYGLQNYADIMSEFAAGERYLNRVWSASADGYINEVNTYLEKARVQFVAAQEQLKALEGASPAPIQSNVFS